MISVNVQMIDLHFPRRLKTRRVLVGITIAVIGTLVIAAVALILLILTTSTPDAPPRPVAGPNTQLQMYASNGSANLISTTDLHYVGVDSSQASAHPCSHGHWTLVVNPENVIGHPYSAMPNSRDWSRAAQAIGLANTVCPAPVTLSWYGHDLRHPALDIWSAKLPASSAESISGAELRQYALRHPSQS